ncbi:CBS domain-containing protein [Streptomyces sp. NPDC054961]
MTRSAISVDRTTAFKDIVETLRTWNVSALPVVAEDGKVVEVVSEADLLLDAPRADTADATTAGRLMTRPAVTVARDATLRAAARLMARSHVKRLPVVDGDRRLTGVVSRGDLLKVYQRPDADMGSEIREMIAYELLPSLSAEVHVHVDNGIAYLYGSLPDPAMEDAVRRAAGTVPGVVAVRSDFTVPVSA